MIQFEEKKLSEVAFFQEGPGVRKHQFTNTGIKLLNVGNINNGILDLSKTDAHISEEEGYGRYKHFLIDEGDLLIASSGIVVENFHNKIAYAKKEHLPLCLNTSTIRFKTLNPSVLNLDYLRLYLKTDHFKQQLKKQITGSAQLNFGPSHLKKIRVPVPGIEHQLQISFLLCKVEGLLTQRKESIRLLDEYIKSVYAEIFGDPVRNEKRWEIGKFSKSLYDILAGSSSSNESKYHDTGDIKVGILKVSAVTKGVFNPEEIKIIRWSQLGNTLLNPQEGDLLFSRANTRELVGATCIVDKNYPDLYIPDKIWVLVLHDTLHNKYFVHHTFQNNTFRKELTKRATGSSGSMLNISMEKLKNVKIPYPPITLQRQFAEIVKKVEFLKKLGQQSLNDLETLFSSLSQLAFNGNLDLNHLHSKAIDEEIRQIIKDGKQKKSAETKLQISPEEDTRYGDPFEVVEATAKKRGELFYKQWLRLHGKNSEDEDSIWLQSKRNGLRSTSIKFNPLEGNAIIGEVFSKQNAGFSYNEFEAVLNSEKITYTAKEVKDFIFKKLEQKELVQYYATKEWIAAMRHPKFNPPGVPEFAGEGSIWFLVNKTEKAK